MVSIANVAEARLPLMLRDAGLPARPSRVPIRVWEHSGVERLIWPDGASAVLKYADHPFDAEHRALRHAAAHDVPVPQVHAAHVLGDVLVMLLTDLGEPTGEAGDDASADAIVAVHKISAAPLGTPTVNEAELRAMPTRIRLRTQHLAHSEMQKMLRIIDECAPARAAGAHVAPFGMCHSEWHPTSLHISDHGQYVLDVARAFTGPGLLDLASWPGTIDDPDVDRVSALIDTYIQCGGSPDASRYRGGLDAASWALGWHRVWVADWFAEQVEFGWADGNETVWIHTIARHLAEATALLKA